jgi:hypothetical protein
LYALLLGVLTGPDASEALLRAPAAVAGVMAIPLVFLLARDFMPSRYALFASLLVAVAPNQIYYSQQVREYSLTFSLAALIILCFARFIARPSAQNALLMAACAAVGMGTQYGIGLLLAGLNLVCIVALASAPERRRAYGLWFLAQLPAGLTAGILLATTVRGQMVWMPRASAGYLASNFWDGTTDGAFRLLFRGSEALVNFAMPGWAFVALAAVGALLTLARRGYRYAVALLVTPIALTAVAALLKLYPYGGIRQDIAFVPLIYVMAARGLQAVADLARGAGRNARGPAGILTVVCAAVVAYPAVRESHALLRSPGIEPMRMITQALRAHLAPGDRIYVYSGAVPAFRYYWAGQPYPWQQGSAHWSGLDPELTLHQMVEVHQELVEALRRPGRLWIVISHALVEDVEDLLNTAGLVRPDLVITEQDGGSFLLEAGPVQLSPDPALRAP